MACVLSVNSMSAQAIDLRQECMFQFQPDHFQPPWLVRLKGNNLHFHIDRRLLVSSFGFNVSKSGMKIIDPLSELKNDIPEFPGLRPARMAISGAGVMICSFSRIRG